MADGDIRKLYFSIGQVSDELGVDAHVLRYWETEFKELAPKKSRSGKRMYRAEDVELAKRIRDLLHVERFTIEGARRRLQIERKLSNSTGNEAEVLRVKLQQVRSGLKELKAMLNG
ncbi:MerR family transcriptional regulator [Calditrichota bacterium]